MINILNPDGTLNANAGKYQGLKILAARERVVADLEALGLVDEIEDREIELAHSDRSKTPIEPYLADQWFIRMQDLAQSAMDAVSDGRVKIIPTRYAKGYLDWLGEKRDWPVSRQLWWGHQIPVWHKTAAIAKPAAEELPAKLVEWEQDGRVALSGSLADESCLICVRQENDAEVVAAIEQGGRFTRDPDVLDTWFSSALWPHSTLGWPERDARAGVLLSDQHAGHQPRHHHAVGGADGADRFVQPGRGAVSRRLHPSQNPGRLWRGDVEVERQRRRSAGRDRKIRRRRACGLPSAT